MQFGAVFPPVMQADPSALRDFIQAIEGMGYAYVLTYEELTNTRAEKASAGFLEPYALLAFAAAISDRLAFATGISVLPIRRTVVAAKQLALLDHLCSGRLRYGVAAGWNRTEYAAAGVDFSTRGRRLDEQIRLLRALWTEPFVTLEGEFHALQGVQIQPRPVQGSIPIWVGGFSNAALKRVARVGDGWIAAETELDSLRKKHARLQQFIETSERDAADIGFEIVDVDLAKPEIWDEWLRAGEDLGAGYMAVTTRHGAFQTPTQHLQRFQQFIEHAMPST